MPQPCFVQRDSRPNPASPPPPLSQIACRPTVSGWRLEPRHSQGTAVLELKVTLGGVTFTGNLLPAATERARALAARRGDQVPRGAVAGETGFGGGRREALLAPTGSTANSDDQNPAQPAERRQQQQLHQPKRAGETSAVTGALSLADGGGGGGGGAAHEQQQQGQQQQGEEGESLPDPGAERRLAAEVRFQRMEREVSAGWGEQQQQQQR